MNKSGMYQVRHEPTFFCSSLENSKPTWRRHAELQFEAKQQQQQKSYFFCITIDRPTSQSLQMLIDQPAKAWRWDYLHIFYAFRFAGVITSGSFTTSPRVPLRQQLGFLYAITSGSFTSSPRVPLRHRLRSLYVIASGSFTSSSRVPLRHHLGSLCVITSGSFTSSPRVPLRHRLGFLYVITSGSFTSSPRVPLRHQLGFLYVTTSGTFRADSLSWWLQPATRLGGENSPWEMPNAKRQHLACE